MTMDFTTVIYQIIGAVWYLIPLFLLVPLLKTAWFKGVFGEFLVNLSVKFFLDKEQYQLIKNVTLPTETGTTQIDHIIVSTYGVFVVETKNMKGWIIGDAHQKMWAQQIYKYSKQFQNPLHQNYKHLKTLESLLEINAEQIFSVIVFVGDSTFKTEMPENVTYGRGYIRFIKSKTRPVLTDSEVKDIIRKIKEGRLTASFKTNRQHIKHVKTIVAEKQNSQQCPKCNSDMVIREAKKGRSVGNKFWGCSKFPKCRETLNI